jgi:hypothetical protein
MIWLYRLLRDHPDAVEHDLSRFHQTDLRGLWTTPRVLTVRRVAVMLRYLPETSAVRIVQRGSDWTRQDGLLDAIGMQIAASRGVPVKDIKPHPASPLAARTGPDPKALAAQERAKKRHAARAERLNPT